MVNGCPRARERIEAGIAQGLHPGAQLYVSLAGSVVADLALGESRPGSPMATDTLNLWMSAVKPVAAVAIAQLVERGLVDLEARVGRYVPEFAVGGKEAITVRHLLTHTSGFRVTVGLERSDPYEEGIQKICRTPLEKGWVPGQTAGYHALTSWSILGEIIRRVDGRPFDQYAREMIFLPANMPDCWAGMPPKVYRNYGNRIGLSFDTRTHRPQLLEANNGEATAASVLPGSNGRGPIAQLGRFYETLLCRDDSPLLKARTIDLFTSPQRGDLYDLTFKHVMNWGLGFMVNSNRQAAEKVAYTFGPDASAAAFGHSGRQASCAFCDPGRKLVVAWLCNGMPGEAEHATRQQQINAAVYKDVDAV
jgi:CubicO group peptidase (beta-lactamase class C family)